MSFPCSWSKIAVVDFNTMLNALFWMFAPANTYIQKKKFSLPVSIFLPLPQ